jgi:hypothetical protein
MKTFIGLVLITLLAIVPATAQGSAEAQSQRTTPTDATYLLISVNGDMQQVRQQLHQLTQGQLLGQLDTREFICQLVDTNPETEQRLRQVVLNTFPQAEFRVLPLTVVLKMLQTTAARAPR